VAGNCIFGSEYDKVCKETPQLAWVMYCCNFGMYHDVNCSLGRNFMVVIILLDKSLSKEPA